ncbi:unnamed protein product [Closterium sp. NIES-54]
MRHRLTCCTAPLPRCPAAALLPHAPVKLCLAHHSFCPASNLPCPLSCTLPRAPPHASCALLPGAPVRPAAQRASAPRCRAHQRAPLPSAPVRPVSQRASAPCCPECPAAQRPTPCPASALPSRMRPAPRWCLARAAALPCQRACTLPLQPALAARVCLAQRTCPAPHALPAHACLRVPALPASACHALPRTHTCPSPHVLPAHSCLATPALPVPLELPAPCPASALSAPLLCFASDPS